jgi:hypothetical protein
VETSLHGKYIDAAQLAKDQLAAVSFHR